MRVINVNLINWILQWLTLSSLYLHAVHTYVYEYQALVTLVHDIGTQYLYINLLCIFHISYE